MKYTFPIVGEALRYEFTEEVKGAAVSDLFNISKDYSFRQVGYGYTNRDEYRYVDDVIDAY